jgi:hypothetical protein
VCRLPGLARAFAATAGCALLASAPVAAAPAKLSIKRGKRIVDFGRAVKISGRLSSGARGGRVALTADRFPFGAFQPVATTKTRKNGRYSFKVKPSFGTRYRSRLAKKPSVRSGLVTVYVQAHGTVISCNYCRDRGHRAPRGPGRFTARATFRETYPKSLNLASRPQYFYWGQHNGSRLPARVRFIKVVHSKRLGPGKLKVVVRHRFKAPRTRYNQRINVCRKDRFASDGFGLPGHHHCGDKAIPYPSYLKYVG